MSDELDIGEHMLLLLRRQVHDGAITEFCGQYFDDGQRIRYWAAENALQALAEVGPRVELTYPPDSGVWRQGNYGPGELVMGVHVGLTVAELTRRASLTELGLAEYKQLCERQTQCDRA